MAQIVRWGVLGAAKIALTKVIPAMQASETTRVVAIASRNLAKAQQAASQLDIDSAHGSYQELLEQANLDCVYIPLPNHLHVPWSIRAAEAGKHVLCEKPISLDLKELRDLIAVRERTGVQIGEAFMVRTHPQWLRVRELVQAGQIGRLRAVVCAFSYNNRDPMNVRNVAEYGGGGLMDIGCYPIQISRFLFEAEPVRVSGALEFDPDFEVDRLASGMLEFPSGGQCVFTCSTQMIPYQRVQIFGDAGRIEVEIPFNAPPDRRCRLFIDRTGDLFGSGVEVEEMPLCNQYTIQGDAFSRAVLDGSEVPTPLEDSLGNMQVIENIRLSAKRLA